MVRKDKKPREFKPTLRHDFQFFNTERLEELERKEFEGERKLKVLKAEIKAQKALAEKKEKEKSKRECDYRMQKPCALMKDLQLLLQLPKRKMRMKRKKMMRRRMPNAKIPNE